MKKNVLDLRKTSAEIECLREMRIRSSHEKGSREVAGEVLKFVLVAVGFAVLVIGLGIIGY